MFHGIDEDISLQASFISTLDRERLDAYCCIELMEYINYLVYGNSHTKVSKYVIPTQ